MVGIDDLDQDYLDDTFNPLLVNAVGFRNKEQFINNNLYELTDKMNNAMGKLQSSYSSVRKKMNFDIGIADNIVYYGIPDSAKRVMAGSSEAKATLRNAFDGHKKRNASL